MCQEAVLKFQISPREAFSNSISPRVLEKFDKSPFVQISAVFGIFSKLTFEQYSETRVFRYLSNHVFRSKQLRSYMSYDRELLFQDVQDSI